MVINNRIEATLDVDTMASKSFMTTGMLEELHIQIRVASQRLTKAVSFTLGNNSEAQCNEITYMDMTIYTRQDTSEIRSVPVFVSPGPAIGDILFGVSEQRAIGMATPQELLASRSRVIGGSVKARDPLERNGELGAQNAQI